MRRYYLDFLVQDHAHGGRWVPSLTLSPAWAAEEEGQLDVLQAPLGEDGVPTDFNCMLIVEAKNHRALGQLTNVTTLPDYPLDVKIASMHGATKTALRQTLADRGVPSSVSEDAKGFREVIEWIARNKFGHEAFSADNFDV